MVNGKWKIGISTRRRFAFNPMVRRHCGCKIKQHATHSHTALEIVKRYLFRSTARHAIGTTRREMAAGRKVSRTRYGPFNSFESFRFRSRRGSKFRNRSQQTFGIWMPWPREQFFNGRLFNNAPRVHDRYPISDFSNYTQIVRDQEHRQLAILSELIQ